MITVKTADKYPAPVVEALKWFQAVCANKVMISCKSPYIQMFQLHASALAPCVALPCRKSTLDTPTNGNAAGSEPGVDAAPCRGFFVPQVCKCDGAKDVEWQMQRRGNVRHDAHGADCVAVAEGLAGNLNASGGKPQGKLEDLAFGKAWAGDRSGDQLLSPIDLQCVKAAGVTFAVSAVERVIEERARGDANKAQDIAILAHSC